MPSARHGCTTRLRRRVLVGVCVLVIVAASATVTTLVLTGRSIPESSCGDANHPVDILLVGSSVASGRDALPADENGWGALLAAELCRRYNLRVHNAATPGAMVAHARLELPALLEHFEPRGVIVGLSTANEGMASAATDGVASATAQRYEDVLYELADEIAAAPTVQLVVLGGVYPCNCYAAHHYMALRSLNARMLARQSNSTGFPVIDFLGAMDDGHGNWRELEWYDAGHPNTLGHRRMFEAIDPTIFAALAVARSRAM